MIRQLTSKSVRLEKRARVVTYVLATVIGGFMIVLGVQYLERIQALTSHGVSAPGQIYNVRYGRGGTGFYRFKANGTPFHGLTSDHTWNKAITVVYLPEDPTISEDVSTINPTRGWLEVGAGMLIMVFYFWTGSRIGRRRVPTV